MLQPAAITALLTQLINHNDSSDSDSFSSRPHTALLTLLDSSELYAVATRLVDSPPPKSAVASILASTAAAAGTAPPPPTNGRPAPLTLDERAQCLSAIAVTAWRQATETSASAKVNKTLQPGTSIALPGSSVQVANHNVTAAKKSSGSKATTRELVPLLLESDLGRILVMPIVPASLKRSQSRSELAGMEESTEDLGGFGENQTPFMLLTLNASTEGPPANLARSPSMSAQGASPAPGSSTATLSAANPTRSRLRSGGTTPTSTRSGDNVTTPSRSPVSEHFPTTPSGPQSTSPLPSGGEGEAGGAVGVEADAAVNEWESRLWAGLYAQAKALARVLAPSLSKCRVGHNHDVDDDSVRQSGRQSRAVTDDEAES